MEPATDKLETPAAPPHDTLVDTRPLDGLRIIAAYMVFFHHYLSSPELVGTFLTQVFTDFRCGVTLFFVLSGFLITYVYYREVSLKPAWLSYYFVRRIARLIPMYLLIALVSLLLIRNSSRWYWFVQLTLLKGFSCEYYLTLVPQAWSLTVEYTFYALAPFIFWFARTRVRLFSTLFIVYAAGLLLNLVCESVYFQGFFCDSRFVANSTFFGRYFEFFVGMSLARFVLTGEGVFLEKVMRFGHKTYSGLLLLAALLAGLALLPDTPGRAVIEFLAHHFAIPCAGGLILLGIITERNLFESLLRSKLFALLGRASYIFFLLQIGVIARLILSHVGGDVALLFVVLNCISVFIYLILEQPVRDYIRCL